MKTTTLFLSLALGLEAQTTEGHCRSAGSPESQAASRAAAVLPRPATPPAADALPPPADSPAMDRDAAEGAGPGDERRDRGDQAPAAPNARKPGAKEEAKELYLLRCGGCHGKDGKARTPMARKLGVKDLTASTRSDAEIEQQIKEGRKGPGGNTLMPAFKTELSEVEIRSLVAFVQSLRK